MTSPLSIADFPLCPIDFHSQNIPIVEADTSPRISSDIDWEFSSTDGTSSFSTYPLFIVDNPSITHTKCSGSSNAFISLMREAKRKKDPKGDLPLSHAKTSLHNLPRPIAHLNTVNLFQTRSDAYRHHRQSNSEDIRSQLMPYSGDNNGNNGHGMVYPK